MILVAILVAIMAASSLQSPTPVPLSRFKINREQVRDLTHPIAESSAEIGIYDEAEEFSSSEDGREGENFSTELSERDFSIENDWESSEYDDLAPVIDCDSNVRCLLRHFMPAVEYSRFECIEDAECSTVTICQRFRCVNPCALNLCGENAVCSVRNHTMACNCPSGYIGDPLVSCSVQPKTTPASCRLNIRPTSTSTTPATTQRSKFKTTATSTLVDRKNRIVLNKQNRLKKSPTIQISNRSG